MWERGRCCTVVADGWIRNQVHINTQISLCRKQTLFPRIQNRVLVAADVPRRPQKITETVTAEYSQALPHRKAVWKASSCEIQSRPFHSQSRFLPHLRIYASHKRQETTVRSLRGTPTAASLYPTETVVVAIQLPLIKSPHLSSFTHFPPPPRTRSARVRPSQGVNL